MNQLPSSQLKKKRPKLEHFQGNVNKGETSEEGKILLDEFTKVLFLNNKDHKKYNLQFWANHFNIEPQKFRNIFNYVSYAIPDGENSRETGKVFRFIYDNVAENYANKKIFQHNNNNASDL